MKSITSDGISLKLIKEGSGSGTVPARVGSDYQYDLITIPHGHPTGEIVWQVSITGYSGDYFSPFYANGDFNFYTYCDDTNLYIEVGDGSAVSQAAIPFDYFYKILEP